MGFLILPALRAIGWTYYLLPRQGRELWARLLGAAMRGLGFRAKVVRENLELACGHGGLSEERREALFREAYIHMGKLALEVLMLLGPMRSYVQRESELKGVEHWREAKARGKGVIFLSSHVGNWEVMAATGALHGGMDLMLVTKHLKPEWLHRAIEASRLRCGVMATYEPRTLRDVLGHLKRNGTVGFVLDQYAGPPVGVRVPVFGVPVGTTTAVATLAKRTGAAVLPVVNYRTPEGRFVVDIRAPLAWIAESDPNREIAINTARFAEDLEHDIYGHPEQWLWTHRRFKGDLSPLREGEWTEGRARR